MNFDSSTYTLSVWEVKVNSTGYDNIIIHFYIFTFFSLIILVVLIVILVYKIAYSTFKLNIYLFIIIYISNICLLWKNVILRLAVPNTASVSGTVYVLQPVNCINVFIYYNIKSLVAL